MGEGLKSHELTAGFYRKMGEALLKMLNLDNQTPEMMGYTLDWNGSLMQIESAMEAGIRVLSVSENVKSELNDEVHRLKWMMLKWSTDAANDQLKEPEMGIVGLEKQFMSRSYGMMWGIVDPLDDSLDAMWWKNFCNRVGVDIEMLME